MTDDDALGADVRRVHDHLLATQERPVERTASRWIGEAESVAGDLTRGDPDPAVLRERLSHVRDLLAEVDGTGDATADEHVAEARRLTADLLERLAAE
jgi:hypothetical protein